MSSRRLVGQRQLLGSVGTVAHRLTWATSKPSVPVSSLPPKAPSPGIGLGEANIVGHRVEQLLGEGSCIPRQQSPI
jgi:hypothetical protein